MCGMPTPPIVVGAQQIRVSTRVSNWLITNTDTDTGNNLLKGIN